MTCRLAIAGKGEHVGHTALGLHLLQALLQGFGHFLSCGHRLLRTVRLVEAALAVDAVEGAHLAIGWQQVDAKRQAETAAMHRAEDG